MATAVAGAGAVIAIAPAGSRKSPHQTADVARVLVTAMPAADARRLVITSAHPIIASKPRVPIAVLRPVLRAAYAGQSEKERIVPGSDLGWTIARLNRLLDKPARGAVKISHELLDKPAAITRADAAATLLDLAESGRYAKSAVNLSLRFNQPKIQFELVR